MQAQRGLTPLGSPGRARSRRLFSRWQPSENSRLIDGAARLASSFPSARASRIRLSQCLRQPLGSFSAARGGRRCARIRRGPMETHCRGVRSDVQVQVVTDGAQRQMVSRICQAFEEMHAGCLCVHVSACGVGHSEDASGGLPFLQAAGQTLSGASRGEAGRVHWTRKTSLRWSASFGRRRQIPRAAPRMRCGEPQ